MANSTCLTIVQESGIGKAINGFRKRDGNVGIYASILVNTWKDLVRKAVRTTVHKHGEMMWMNTERCC